MAYPLARKTKAQADQLLVHSQGGFLGGMNSDLAMNSIEETELPWLENMIAYREGMEARPGTRALTGTEADPLQLFQLSSGTMIAVYSVYIYRRIWQDENLMDNTLLSVSGQVPSFSNLVKMLEWDGKLWFFCTSGIYSTPLTNGDISSSLVFTYENPPAIFAGPTWTGNPSGVYKYSVLFTLAKVSDTTNPLTTVIRESGTTRENVQTVQLSSPWGSGGYGPEDFFGCSPTLVAVGGDSRRTDAIDSGYNAVLIYRTTEITNGDTLLFARVGAIVLDTTQRTSSANDVYRNFNGIYNPSSALGVSDDNFSGTLSVYGIKRWLSNPFPNPSSTSNIVATPGFLFQQTGSRVDYIDIAAAEMGLFYKMSLQYIVAPALITSLVKNQYAIIICCTNCVLNLSTSTSTDAGNANLGESIPVLSVPTVTDPSLGVLDGGSVAEYKSGGFFARCSDGSIRIYENNAWSTDYSKGKIGKYLRMRQNKGQLSISLASGIYYLWFHLGDPTDANPTSACIRLSVMENVGSGFSFMSGAGWPFPNKLYMPPVKLIDGRGGVRLAVWLHNSLGTLLTEIECGQTETLPRPVDDLEDSGNMRTPVIPIWYTRELIGSSEELYVEHMKTSIYPHAIPGQLIPSGLSFSGKIFVDGSPTESQEIPVSAGTATLVYSGPVIGNRFYQIISANKGGFFVPSYTVQFRSREERPLTESTSQKSFDQQLAATGMWLSRKYPLINTADPSFSSPVIGSLSIEPGPDNYNSSFQGQAGFYTSPRSYGNGMSILFEALYPTLTSAHLLSVYDADSQDVSHLNEIVQIFLVASGGPKLAFQVWYKTSDNVEHTFITTAMPITVPPPEFPSFAIVFTGTSMTVYYNGAVLLVYPTMAGLFKQSNSVKIFVGDLYLNLYDFRLINSSLSSDAVVEYVRDMTAGQYIYHPSPRYG